MTLAVMGYHLQVMTRRLSKAMDAAVKAHEMQTGQPTESRVNPQ